MSTYHPEYKCEVGKNNTIQVYSNGHNNYLSNINWFNIFHAVNCLYSYVKIGDHQWFYHFKAFFYCRNYFIDFQDKLNQKIQKINCFSSRITHISSLWSNVCAFQNQTIMTTGSIVIIVWMLDVWKWLWLCNNADCLKQEMGKVKLCCSQPSTFNLQVLIFSWSIHPPQPTPYTVSGVFTLLSPLCSHHKYYSHWMALSLGP